LSDGRADDYRTHLYRLQFDAVLRERHSVGYTAKLAMFPPWKAPVTYETLPVVFATVADAWFAAEKALTAITARELLEIAPQLQPSSKADSWLSVTVIAVPEEAVHGFIIYDEGGVEVANWTTLDVAVEEAAPHGG
jgi:hypothetical protein